MQNASTTAKTGQVVLVHGEADQVANGFPEQEVRETLPLNNMVCK